jgi:hypothetical protein
MIDCTALTMKAWGWLPGVMRPVFRLVYSASLGNAVADPDASVGGILYHLLLPAFLSVIVFWNYR